MQMPDACTVGRWQAPWQPGVQVAEGDAGEAQGQYQDQMGAGYTSTQTGIERSP